MTRPNDREGRVADRLRGPLRLALASLEQLASRIDLLGGVASAGDVEQAGEMVRSCREAVQRIAILVEQAGAQGAESPPAAVPALVEVGRLMRVTVDEVARACPNTPSIALDLPMLPPMRTDGRILGLLVAHLVGQVLERAASAPGAAVEIAVRPGRHGDGVEILIAAGRSRANEGPLSLLDALACDLACALRGAIDDVPSDAHAAAVLVRVPSMP